MNEDLGDMCCWNILANIISWFKSDNDVEYKVVFLGFILKNSVLNGSASTKLLIFPFSLHSCITTWSSVATIINIKRSLTHYMMISTMIYSGWVRSCGQFGAENETPIRWCTRQLQGTVFELVAQLNKPLCFASYSFVRFLAISEARKGLKRSRCQEMKNIQHDVTKASRSIANKVFRRCT